MKKKLFAIFVPLIVVILGTIVVFIFLLFPGISPFQEPTLAINITALAALMSTLTTLAIAWYAGLQLFENRRLREENTEQNKREKELRQLDDVIRWARSIAEWNDDDLFSGGEYSMVQHLLKSSKRTNEYTRFCDEGANIIFPTISSAFEQRKSLISSITSLIEILNELLALLWEEQMSLVRIEFAKAQMFSEDKIKERIDKSNYKAFEVTNTLNRIRGFAKAVIKEAIAVKLSI